MKKLQELNLCDDFLFFKVMQDTELCRELLEMIFKKPIRKVINQSEKSVKTNPKSRGIRLDVYLEGDDKVYVVEMQQGKQKELPKRSRYYQSVMDVEWLAAGESVRTLRESFVIFICTFPVFDGKRNVYSFRNICMEDSRIQMGDGTSHIFISTRGEMNDISPQMAEFLKFVENSQISDCEMDYEFTKRLKKKVSQVKSDKSQEVEYMTYETRLRDKWEEGLETGRKEGLETGRKEGLETGLLAFIEDNLEEGCSIDTLSAKLEKRFNLTKEEALEYVNKYKQKGLIY